MHDGLAGFPGVQNPYTRLLSSLDAEPQRVCSHRETQTLSLIGFEQRREERAVRELRCRKGRGARVVRKER